MKILVTGGTGYIGSHTVVELLQHNYEVVIADNLSNSSIDVLDAIVDITGKKPIFEQVDVSKEEEVRYLFATYPDIQAVIHFAAFKAVGESVEQPLKYYDNNINSLLHILNYLRQGVLVFSSSCTVYGQPTILPVTESSPIQEAMSPYGHTKQVCETIISNNIVANPNQKAIILRYFNPIGAHESALIGELPKGVPNNLMPYITQTAIGMRNQLTVYGSDYNTVDGTCIRDYIHVVDLAKAHVKALEKMLSLESKKIDIFNIGTGNGFTVLETIQSFEKVTQQKLKYTIGARRLGDIEKVWADTTKANKELGWKAEKTLDEMTLSAWKWQNYLQVTNRFKDICSSEK